MKGFKTIPIKFKCEPITIKEPYKPEVKEFADTDEFTRYFRANEDTFKEAASTRCLRDTSKEAAEDPEKPARFLTANKLNRTYKIPGYRIRIVRKGTDNEELTLVKDYSKTSSDDSLNEELNNETIEQILGRLHTAEISAERVYHLEELIQRLTDQVNNIEAFLVQFKR